MKALFLLYEGYVDWEISVLSGIFKMTQMEADTVAVTRHVRHVGGFKVEVDHLLADVDPSQYDALIIPGGEPLPLAKEGNIKALIQAFHQQDKLVAGICGGTVYLAAAGILEGRPYSTSIDSDEHLAFFERERRSAGDVTIDRKVITSEGNAYVEFAIEVSKALRLFRDREDELETVLFFKNALRG
ncbi:DJ-1/PfpI family protein [Exiguobacterium flavidum]|uniref:DJ-1/PfpI family protein n=1 Tax=Exiguobacterium flavidum TaxID=2184695 RepID=UPI000DF78E5D|nr:DJ-1/PfpI family protein [Exiguobacterium flavidum]